MTVKRSEPKRSCRTLYIFLLLIFFYLEGSSLNENAALGTVMALSLTPP